MADDQGSDDCTTKQPRCLFCGSIFKPKKKGQATCSVSCGLKLRSLRKGQHLKQEQVCGNCGKRFMPKASNRNKFCSRECAFDFKKAKPRRPKPKEFRTCVVCKRGFYGPSQRITCCVACHKERIHLKHIAKYKPRPLTRVVCIVCGEVLLKKTAGRPQEHCSRRCYKKSEKKKLTQRSRMEGLRRARAMQAGEDFSPYEIFARDNWTCQLCGKKVAQGPSVLNLKAVLDHIIPLAKGGEHTRKNVQCAHFVCNSRRREVGAAQMRLFDDV